MLAYRHFGGMPLRETFVDNADVEERIAEEFLHKVVAILLQTVAVELPD